jgi:hypothetical protein
LECPRCEAAVVEEVPWGGKRTLTRAYMLFLARWARRLSSKETAEAFLTSWDKVFSKLLGDASYVGLVNNKHPPPKRAQPSATADKHFMPAQNQ